MTDEEKQRIREWLAKVTAISVEDLAAMDDEELDATNRATLRAHLEAHT